MVTDKDALAALEASNALRQFDEVRRLAVARIAAGALSLSPADVCSLQAIAVDGIFACAGTFRPAPIVIFGTPHRPPPPGEVPGLVDEMCEYANRQHDNALHASAYLMWRLNWIHPFADGNGRTSRAVSYLALCCNLGMELPGTVTVPDLIVRNRDPYYAALDDADAARKAGRLDVSGMESLIEKLLSEQLQSSV